MPVRTSTDIVDREFLELRARLLELGASFDRIARADGSSPDARMRMIEMGLSILADDQDDKARRIQQLFSREYSPGWRDEFGV